MGKYKSVAIHTRSEFWTDKDRGEEFVVDSNDLAKEIDIVCNKFDEEGYEIISIMPVDSGNFTNGTGYSYTESVVVTGKK